MKLKRILASILCFAMVLSAMGTVVFAEESTIENTTTAPEDVLNTGDNYSTVYYGGIPWRVLDKEFSDGQDEPTNGIYLLSEYAYGYGTYWNAHYGPGDYVWHRTGIFTRLDVQHHPEGYKGDSGNTSPTNLGYQESDIRKYMTGVGEYEAVFPRSMHEHGNPDNSGLNVSSYFWKTKVTESEPIEGVEYYIKGDFRLSDHEFNNYKTLSVSAKDWLPDTWYVKDDTTGEFTLVEEAPAEGVTLTCYHDASEYYKVGELDSFEDGVDYYTFEKISAGMPEWEYTKLEMQANSIAKAAIYCAFTVTDMYESTSADVEGEGRVILSGENNRSFASDMGFTDVEQSLVLPVNRTGYTNGAARTPSIWTYKNSGAYSDEFVNDTYFLPTAADLNTYLDDNGISKATTFANGDSAQYWLSSMLRYDRVGMVDGGGGEWYQHPTFKTLGIRPAFVLNPDAVVAYVPIADNAYRMVALDESKTDFVVESVKTDLTVLKVKYSGAVAGANEYISCVAKDENGKSYYLRSEAITETEGTIEFDLANSGAKGALSLYFINETCDVEDEKATTTAKNISETFGATIIYVTPDEDDDESNDATIQGAVDTVSGNEGEFVIVVNGDRTENVEVIDYADGQQIAIAGKVDEIPVINGRFVVNGNDKNETGFILKNIIFNNNGAMMFARNAVYTVDVSNITNSLIENVVISDIQSGISFIGVGDAVISDTTIDVSGNAVYVGEGANVSITSGTYKGAIEVATGGTLSITGGSFSHNVSAYVADGYELTRTADGYVVVEDSQIGDPGRDQADSISVVYELESEIEGEKVYNVIVKANDDDVINELASVDLTFAFTETPIANGDITFAVAPAAGFAITEHDSTVREELTKRYMFNYNGVDGNYEGTANEIVVATITVTGYGEFKIATADVDTNIVNATTLYDNLVDSYTAAGATDDDATTGALDISGKIDDGKIAVPDRNLVITIDFPNAIIDNVIAYQDMKVVISGGDLVEDITIDLGTDAVATELDIFGKEDAEFIAEMVDGSYVINVTDTLTLNNAYTVTVSGAGYRTARYTVTMTEDKALRFWNNVMDEAQVVEIGKDSSAVNVTFLAGDIVKDNKINIYDLSAVVSYFGTETNTTSYDAYAKYDLNRDGVIDSKDVAYVLVSWDN